MLVTVASVSGPSMDELLDRPLWLTMYMYHHANDERRRQALERRRDRIDAGFMTAHAFNKPENLLDELRAVRDAIETHERGPDHLANAWASSLARSQQMMQRSEEITTAMRARGETPTVEVLH